MTPSLPTITISDDIKPSKTQPTTVRERFRALSSNVRIRCIDIGVFEIHHAGALELFYEDTALRRLLPPVRDLAAKYELEELDGILGANRETLPHGEHVNHIRNAICLQEYECLQSQHDATADKVAVQMPRVTLTHAVPLRTELFSDDLKLIDVTEREHGSEALEWSSEFLSLNLCDRR